MLKRRSLNHLRKLYAKKKKTGPKYQFGERVPRSIKEAELIHKESKNTGWKDAINQELQQLVEEYKWFKILEKGEKPTPGYLYIPLLWTFANKYDGRKTARCVAGGHMTPRLILKI